MWIFFEGEQSSTSISGMNALGINYCPNLSYFIHFAVDPRYVLGWLVRQENSLLMQIDALALRLKKIPKSYLQ